MGVLRAWVVAKRRDIEINFTIVLKSVGVESRERLRG